MAGELIAGFSAEHLLADKAYDTNAILAQAQAQGMAAQIPPKRTRLVQREYDKHLYKLRHLVENAIRSFKEWRAIATRYAKRATSFLAIAQIRCMALWFKTRVNTP